MSCRVACADAVGSLHWIFEYILDFSETCTLVCDLL